jgi:predicted nucleic-acid-binding protein
MPKNILVDLNVILDVLLERQGFEASRGILELQESAAYDLYVSAHAVTTFAYLLEHAKVSQPEIRRHVNWLLGTFSVIATTDEILKAAAHSRLSDYEDAVVEQAARACKASVIITRNTKDFKHSAVDALMPESYK